MLPITQTKVVVRNSKDEIVIRGNCYAAAIASLLEIPITEVPNVETLFHIEGQLWLDVMLKFLESKGYKLQTKSVTEDGYYYIASGDSPRGVKHSVIYFNGKMVHDPHPTREGLLSIDYYERLMPITR